MKNIMKKMFAVLMATAIYLSVCPLNDMTLNAADANETDLESIIREQIEKFAKSIDKTNADDAAAKALASHGINGRGKKLSVGKNHALTATIWNSELMKEALTRGCAKLIQFMRESGRSTLYEKVNTLWYSSRLDYGYLIYLDQQDIGNLAKYVFTSGVITFDGKSNAYDKSLIWMVGTAGSEVCVKHIQESKETDIYNVSVTVKDRFDFHTSSGSGFNNLISGLGAIFFKEFDWESKVSFTLTVPKPVCTHEYNGETDGDCNSCGEVRFIRGDMNGDNALNSTDVTYLMRHIMMPKTYPMSQPADINGDGAVNSVDAVYLLRHMLMPKQYPLK